MKQKHNEYAVKRYFSCWKLKKTTNIFKCKQSVEHSFRAEQKKPSKTLYESLKLNHFNKIWYFQQEMYWN